MLFLAEVIQSVRAMAQFLQRFITAQRSSPKDLNGTFVKQRQVQSVHVRFLMAFETMTGGAHIPPPFHEQYDLGRIEP